MTFIFDVAFALSESIPEFDCPITGTRDNPSVVSAKANGEDIGSVSNKTTGRGTGVQVPQTEGMVPGRGQCKLTIRRDDNVRNEMVVAGKNSFWVSVGIFVTGQLPNNNRLVWLI